MDPERWRRIEALYHSALECEPTDRPAYLAGACGDDGDLRDEVAALLAQSDSSVPLVESTSFSTLENQERMRCLPALARGEILGHYRIASLLGEGGMGRVYRAMDTRLGRAVAIKVSAEEFSNRFEREARAISALNHPHICTLHDIGRLPSGGAYMVTELVDGQTLREWLRGSPSEDRRIDAARQILEALRAAHGAGIIHRDLKPANIMVRFDGYVKVLDFGLAKRISVLGGPTKSDNTATATTIPGRIIGTVAYMSPEQILGQELDARSDLFAFGIILYEIMAGRHPWPHEVTAETLHAILKDPPPPLESAWAGVLEKLLRKNREERYASAKEVLDALANPACLPAPPKAKLTRLIVLPFRILRPHEPSDFLSLALPDAITTSLAAIDSLLVRSSMVAAQLASVAFDVKTISERAQVDAILTGSILSDGEKLRVNTQLVQAPDGELIWSNTAEVSLQDIFRLQDSLVERIVQGLAVPLTAREQRALRHDVPMSAIAYEFYLRGNQIAAGNSFDPRKMSLARDLYLRSVEQDPKYAPAWACLGRAYRLIGKYGGGDPAENIRLAEGAFRQAFTLHPDLAMAHNYYAALETETGRTVDAMGRLLKRAQNRRNDPNLLTGLVQACRYCDLLEASLAAHRLARQLDPNVRTSVAYTHLRLAEFQDALNHSSGPADCVVLPALMGLGYKKEAIANTHEVESLVTKEYVPWIIACRASVEGDLEKGREAIHCAMQVLPLQDSDPEAAFDTSTLLAALGEPERAFQVLSSALDKGYHCHHAMLHDPGFGPLRSDARFTNLLNRASEMSRRARTVFLDNRGDWLLGLS
jgi:serine/threonine protein kinase/tetratricopeptide (TPR) repeat protein